MGRTGRKKTRARRARWEDLFPLSIVPRALFRLLLFYRDAQSGSLCGGERVPLLTLEAPLCLLPLYHCRIPISTIRNRGNSFVQSFPLGLRLHWRNFQPDKKQSTNINQTFSSLFERQLGPVLSKRFLKIYTLQVSKNCLELVPGDSTFPENNFLQSVENHKLICLLRHFTHSNCSLEGYDALSYQQRYKDYSSYRHFKRALKEWLEAVLYLSESGSHNKVVFFYKKWVDS